MKQYLLAGMMSLGLFCAMPAMATGTTDAIEPTAATAKVPSATTAAENKINLNTADEKQLNHSIKGIGEKRAMAIVKFRKEHGNFKSVEDLANVPGIGKKFVKKNHDLLMSKFVTE